MERLGKELIRVARAVLSELQRTYDNWFQTIPMIYIDINITPSPQRINVPPMTASTGRPPSTPISTILRDSDAIPLTLTHTQKKNPFNIADTVKDINNLHPTVQSSLADQGARMRECRNKGDLANLRKENFVLVTRDVLDEGEKFFLGKRGRRRVRKALNGYCFQVENLCNDILSGEHSPRLKFYHDPSLDTTTILSHVLSSETGMPVPRLLRIVEYNGRILVAVR